MLVSDRTKEAAAVLSRMGLELDSWLYHPQLDEVADGDGSEVGAGDAATGAAELVLGEHRSIRVVPHS